jgi:hypothetical protein
MHGRPRAVAALFAMALAVGSAPAALAQQDGDVQVQVVARGLDNPRGIDVRGDGSTFFVAEAGRGGDDVCATFGDEEICGAYTGAITRVRNGEQRKVVRRLPSQAAPDGSFAVGVHDVVRNRAGKLVMVFGGAGTTEDRAKFPKRVRRLMGRVVKQQADGDLVSRGDLTRFETNRNPDGTDVNPNPYSLVLTKNGPVVADAGANTVVQARRNRMRLVAVVPPTGEFQPVPTAITKGPDGAFYVGQLLGGPSPKGAAKVYRVTRGGRVSVYAEGFSTIHGIAFDNQGRLLVSELSSEGFAGGEPQGPPPGRLVRVEANGEHTELLGGDVLQAPGDVDVASNGDIFIVNGSVFAGGGQVLRVRP